MPIEATFSGKKYSELKVILDDVAASPTECDGCTRLISHVLSKFKIRHDVFIGRHLLAPGVLHFWIELKDDGDRPWVIDYRIKRWVEAANSFAPEDGFDPIMSEELAEFLEDLVPKGFEPVIEMSVIPKLEQELDELVPLDQLPLEGDLTDIGVYSICTKNLYYVEQAAQGGTGVLNQGVFNFLMNPPEIPKEIIEVLRGEKLDLKFD